MQMCPESPSCRLSFLRENDTAWSALRTLCGHPAGAAQLLSAGLFSFPLKGKKSKTSFGLCRFSLSATKTHKNTLCEMYTCLVGLKGPNGVFPSFTIPVYLCPSRRGTSPHCVFERIEELRKGTLPQRLKVVISSYNCIKSNSLQRAFAHVI